MSKHYGVYGKEELDDRHDHLCRCDDCDYEGPEPDDEEAQRIEAEIGPEPVDDDMPALAEAVARREEWRKLLDVPSYVETQAAQFAKCDISQVIEDEEKKPLVVWMEDALIHTMERPFCYDVTCGCHDDEELFAERIEQPVQSGLLKIWDAQHLLWPESVEDCEDGPVNESDLLGFEGTPNFLPDK